MSSNRHWVVGLWVLAGTLLAGCPQTGIVCREGTAHCGEGCADFSSDHRNCGACGVACQSGQVCQSSKCICQPGSISCDGICVVLESDIKNCGSCGNACAFGQVCDNKQCRTDCISQGAVDQCNGACVNLQTDSNHCGSCGHACVNAQSCHAGQCSYDLVASCYSTGQVTGLNASSLFRGPLEPLGSGPGPLAIYKATLLAADQTDNRVTQAALYGAPLAFNARYTAVGSVANQIVTAAPYVYVANAGSGTLQVLKEGADAGHTARDGGAVRGVQLGTVAELQFGANTYPQGLAIVSNTGYVPLYGGFTAVTALAGQKLVPVNLTNPEAPMAGAPIDLQSLDLKPFDGGSSFARPYAIFAHKGKVYVVLNNLNEFYQPGGPGLLARFDPALPNAAPTIIDLGADCLNPAWGAGSGDSLIVSCQGAASYDPNTFALTSIANAGVVLIDEAGARHARWKSECPAGSALPDGGTTCPLVFPGRFTLHKDRVYVTDQNAGRIFVLKIAGHSLVEERGFSADGGAIAACAINAITGIANVADIAVVP